MQQSASHPRSVVRLSEYRPPDWWSTHIDLVFELDPERTVVTARTKFERNTAAPADAPLVLNGEHILELRSVKIDGTELDAAEAEYVRSDTHLTIPRPPADRFELEVVNVIAPAQNTALEGLYMSSGMYCTQCEAEGFRRITYSQDRPDVMSLYTTTIIADTAGFPVLLSNGNPVDREELTTGDRRLTRVTWEDPFPKPSYLFALVAGDLGVVRDTFTTMSGRDVACEVYVDRGNESRAEFAVQALKDAMAWDERRFGREYDLDIYMIVAVDDFNMGAMENKGLNIFNSKLVLADPRTATDESFEFIQGVVGHEYFHNWTGNRVTCRDWFQLTLKEGLTVYRDQLFTADMTHPAIKRIKDVEHLRAFQFPEDAGPMSHPIQPKHYIEINNFYTMTVYEKGAEVIRMMATIAGEDGFRRAMDVYFQRNDGRAVTTEEFVAAIEAGSGTDLKQFRRWYDQSGTPRLRVAERYDAAAKRYELTLTQSNPDYTPPSEEGPPEPPPLLIPVKVGLLHGHSGAELLSTRTLLLSESEQTFVFENIDAEPVLSILRDFSAPVKLEYPRDPKRLAFLLAHDTDLFQRCEAGRELMRLTIEEVLADIQAGRSPQPTSVDALHQAFAELLKPGSDLDPAYLALAISLPPESTFTNEQNRADFAGTHEARSFVARELSTRNRDRLLELYETLRQSTASENPDRRRAVGERKLKNRVLSYLMKLDEPELDALCLAQQKNAANMTDETGAMYLLADSESSLRKESLRLFYERWHHDALVIDHWFSAQALSSRADTLTQVQALRSDPVFQLRNPNKVRALLGAFSRNALRFHEEKSYAFLADCIVELDAINPGIAARLARAWADIGRLPENLAEAARGEMRRIRSREHLSNDVYEVIDRSLNF